MAFTEAERVKVRFFLGWSARFHQTDSRLEQAMNAVGENIGAIGELPIAGPPSPGDTVTIGTRTYTFSAAPAAPDDVRISASAPYTANLAAAINLTGTAGTTYGTGTTANTQVTAAVDTATDTLTVTAIRYGREGNDIATTATGVGIAWVASTLLGGAGDNYDTEAFVRDDLLVSLDDVRTKLTGAHNRLKAAKVGSIVLPMANEISILRSEGRRHAGSLAAVLGVDVRRDVFGTSGAVSAGANYYPQG